MKRIHTPDETRVYPARLLFTCMSILCHGTAWAHAGAIMDSIDINGPFEDEHIGLETSVGYLKGHPADSFSWVCHESVTQPDAIITPRYTESPSGTALVIVGVLDQARDTAQSLYRSEDMCNWSAPEGLTGQQVADVAFDPNDPLHALAITANPEGTNALFRSIDGGLTWTETSLQTDERTFRSVLFGGMNTHSVWISSVRHETDEGWIYHSIDAGMTWTEHAVDIPTSEDLDIYVDVAIADQNDPNRAWIVVGPFLDDQLLETKNGGQNFEEAYAPDGDIIDATQDNSGGLWLITTGNKVIHSENGEFFQRVESAPMSLGVASQDNDIYLANRIPSEGFPLSIGQDGRDFEPIEAFQLLTGPPDCEPESDSSTYCEPLWPQLSAMINGSEDTAAPADTNSEEQATHSEGQPKSMEQQGCCSDQTKSSNAGLLALLLVGLGHNRRRRSEK